MSDINFTLDEQIAALLEHAKLAPGIAFEPANIEFLTVLRSKNRPTFEAVRAKLKELGCRVTELDKAISPAGDGGRGPAQAEILIGFANDCELFHSKDKKAFVDAAVSGHRETMRVRSKSFRNFLARRYYDEQGGAPNSEAMQAALGVIEAQALYEGIEREVFVRVGASGGKIYIDLGTDDWSAVEIDATGWRVVEVPPVRFRRSAGMRPLPVPTRGGRIADLRRFLNVKSDADFTLVVSWLLAAMRPTGPFPLLALSGEQGSAKSTFTAIMRKLVDPNTAPLRALPREDRDLFIAASNSFVLAYDNISGLPAWISDTLCRLATGGGFAVRSLYSDGDETLFDACRPIVCNGIEDALTRADLADRAITVSLLAIPDDKRLSESELWREFDAAHPAIFGALADAVSIGLRRLPTTKLDRLPRMADFALWATACEPAHVASGAFMTAYNANRTATIDTVLEADAVANAVLKLIAERSNWSGTASELLGELNRAATDEERRSRTWPSAANVLAGRLKRAATFLRRTGVNIEFGARSGGQTKRLTITRLQSSTSDDVPTSDANLSGCPRNSNGRDGEGAHVFDAEGGGKSSSPIVTSSQANGFNGLAVTIPVTIPQGSDDHSDDAFPGTVNFKAMKSHRNDDVTIGDDDFGPVSGAENTCPLIETGEAF